MAANRIRPPFKMLPSHGAVLRRDGKFVVGGRASFAWETYVQCRAAGVPGAYEIRRSWPNPGPWHQLRHTVEQAEQTIIESKAMSAPGQLRRARATRERRRVRGLEVN